MSTLKFKYSNGRCEAAEARRRRYYGLALTWKAFLAAGGMAMLAGPGLDSSAEAQAPSTFTYQGVLRDGGGPVTGSQEMIFSLYDAEVEGNLRGQDYHSAGVTNGLFTVPLDFGTNAFDGGRRWLGIQINGTDTLPRQEVTPAPYAFFANTAGRLSGAVPGAQLSGTYGNALTLSSPSNRFTGTFTGDGSGLTNLNCVQFGTCLATAVTSFLTNTLRFFADPLNGAPSIIGGSPANEIQTGAIGSVIAGGGATTDVSALLPDEFDTVLPPPTNGPRPNIVDRGPVFGNVINVGNEFPGRWQTIAGGVGNRTAGCVATVGGGLFNSVAGNGGTVPGGAANWAGGLCSFAAGASCVANGPLSFALGWRARATNTGSFVWADGSGLGGFDVLPNQFAIFAANGVVANSSVSAPRLYATGPADTVTIASLGKIATPELDAAVRVVAPEFDAVGVPGTIGAEGAMITPVLTSPPAMGLALEVHNFPVIYLAPGGFEVDIGAGNPPTTPTTLAVNGPVDAAAFIFASDRHLKANLEPVDHNDVLDRVVSLPITRWSYLQDRATRHIGPMAQDFYAAFRLGADERHISTVDEGGVALAAIQGLNQKLELTLRERDARIADLEQRLRRLETVLSNSTPDR